jgi:hypothetical protein
MDEEIEPKKPKKTKVRVKRLIVVIALIVVGIIMIAGAASILFYNIGNGPGGYAYSNVYHVNTSSYAFTAYMNEYKISTWGFLGANNVAEIKFIATPTDPSSDLFIGYATTVDSQAYSNSFQCEIPTYWSWWAEPYYAEIYINTTTVVGAGAPAQLPQEQTFWLASADSPGTVTMIYLPQHEQHVWFIMNSDGSRNVSADIQIAFRSPILAILPAILIVGGLIFIGAAVYVLKRKNKNQL